MDRDEWTDLPPDLLTTVSDNLPQPLHTLNLRWVCRSWRSATPPPPNILSPFVLVRRPSLPNMKIDIIPTAIYLLRPRSDPSKAWLVSVTEPFVGELFPRHALTYEMITRKKKNCLDGSSPSDHWISSTQICRSFESNPEASYEKKVAFVSNSSGSELVGLWKSFRNRLYLFAFILDLMSTGGNTNISCPFLGDYRTYAIEDFVKLNGRIYAVNNRGYVYVFDEKTMKLCRVDYGTNRVIRTMLDGWARLVVSDGDLYFVTGCRITCLVYRLSVNTMDQGWNEVTDLGDKVFFVNQNCSFSVSARDLPPPWKRNCIVYFPGLFDKIRVFHLGRGDDQNGQPISALQGYSDLFDPPSSWKAWW